MGMTLTLRLRWLAVALALVLIPALAYAQEPPKNPRTWAFESVDHATITAYEFTVRDPAKNAAGTLVVAKSDTAQIGTTPEGIPTVQVTLNLQPIAFGDYTLTVRAVAGPYRSSDSEESVVWQRVPGAPGRATPK